LIILKFQVHLLNNTDRHLSIKDNKAIKHLQLHKAVPLLVLAKQVEVLYTTNHQTNLIQVKDMVISNQCPVPTTQIPIMPIRLQINSTNQMVHMATSLVVVIHKILFLLSHRIFRLTIHLLDMFNNQ